MWAVELNPSSTASRLARILRAVGLEPLGLGRPPVRGAEVVPLPFQRIRPALLYPAALLATVSGVVFTATDRFLPTLFAFGVAAAAWWQGHRQGFAHAEAARRERRLSGLHLATIEALALAIDAKDKTSSSHIRRMQSFARAIAEAIGVSPDETQGIATAALLHDIGKLAVPEHILSKPGPLTDEEFQKIHIHPQVGFEIIEHVPFPYPVAPLVLCHHERWDGKGYPLGLRGEDIPLGARVLAVADYFDSLTRDRPYNKSMSLELAVLMLRQEAGKALDPRLVSVFLDLLPTLPLALGAADGDVQNGADVQGAIARSRRLLENGERSAFENIARAHQEIYALYEIAQAIGSSLGVGDTMSLIAEKLSALVPFSCCALYLRDDDNDVLRCEFSKGVDADLIRRVSLRSARGLAGWVARNRRSLVNGRPAADLEASEIPMTTTQLRSALACPLVYNDRVVGTLSLYHVEPEFYNDEHRRLLDQISEQMAAAISNSLVFEQTREASLSDPLTGLPNTRFMFTHLGRELARAERHASQVAILVLDLDDFKRINDTHGHHVGDRALREVARVLRETIRPYDICVRYAGDEFVIVLTDCGTEEAEAKRAELQAAVESIAFEAAPGQPVTVGLSIGAAVYPVDGESHESLLATADGRMYRDKKNRKRAAGSGRIVRRPLTTVAEPDADRGALVVARTSGRVN
jgi:diguanylate cyclase (GGDEF)-like protein